MIGWNDHQFRHVLARQNNGQNRHSLNRRYHSPAITRRRACATRCAVRPSQHALATPHSQSASELLQTTSPPERQPSPDGEGIFFQRLKGPVGVYSVDWWCLRRSKRAAATACGSARYDGLWLREISPGIRRRPGCGDPRDFGARRQRGRLPACGEGVCLRRAHAPGVL